MSLARAREQPNSGAHIAETQAILLRQCRIAAAEHGEAKVYGTARPSDFR